MTETPKLLMVFEKFGEFGYLGEEYLRAFYENDWHVTVCYLSGAIEDGYRRELPVHRVISFGLSRTKVRGLKTASIRKMHRLLSKERFDLVISQQYQANSSVAAAGFFKPDLVKYAVFHGIDPVSARSRKWFYSTVGRRFTRFICVSEAQRRNIISRCPSLPDEKFSVIHNVINTERALEKMISREEARKSLGLSPEDFVVGTISRLTWKKRPLDILYAFKEIEERLPEGKLLIIGTGGLENRIAGEAERFGLTERLVCPGYINEAWRLMRAFDVFVLPSAMESCPLVLLEAMCAKVLITAADAQGIKETLNGAGYLYETGNFRELAERLLAIYNLSDQEKMRIADTGFQRVESEFAKEVFQERLVSLANHDLGIFSAKQGRRHHAPGLLPGNGG